jgi:hypothetical protein
LVVEPAIGIKLLWAKRKEGYAFWGGNIYLTIKTKKSLWVKRIVKYTFGEEKF